MFPFGAKNAVLDPGLRGLAAVRELIDVRCLSSLITQTLDRIRLSFTKKVRFSDVSLVSHRIMQRHRMQRVTRVKWPSISHLCVSCLASVVQYILCLAMQFISELSE